MSNEAADAIFLGRQSILDRQQRLVAYELLFRNDTRNAASFDDGTKATATVIVNTYAELGIAAALGPHQAYINVDEAFLFSDMIELLPRESVVLEILETIPPTPDVIARCRELKSLGFQLALDDIIDLSPAFAELHALVDIIKVDIMQVPPGELPDLVTALKPLGKILLAEKVDSREQMQECLELGFALFQGYYFARPSVLAGKKMEHSHLTLLKLLALLLEDPDIADLEAVLKPEPGLTVNLLRLTNSVGAGLRHKTTSLRHAIEVLGHRQLQRWLQLLLFAADDVPLASNPLLLMAATRGRLMELLAGCLHPDRREFADQAFMVGIMSLIPALIGQPIEKVVSQLGLADDLRNALCNGVGPLGDLLAVTIGSENADLNELAACYSRLPELGHGDLNRAQTDALLWANHITLEQDS